MYRVYVNDGYIVSIAHNAAEGNITDAEYARIEDAIRGKPTPPQGFDYRLREDLAWELYELPQSCEDEE